MNRLRRPFMFAVALVAIAAVGLVGQSAKPTGAKLADAANAFLGTLPADLRSKAVFDWKDPHRTTWYFTPQQDNATRTSTRKGVPLEKLNAGQKDALMQLLKAGLSAKGYDQATTIMSLEGILLELEGPKSAMVRNKDWYFVSIFGEPSATGLWAWRFEGHHMSINMTLDKGQVVAATPLMFGANPAEVKSGDKKGLRTLPEIEDLARDLVKSLSDDQRSSAKQAKALPEIKEKQADADVGSPVGVAAAKLTESQKKTLWNLIEAYANRIPSDAAAEELARVKSAGLEKVHFAYAGDPTPGKGYTYRVHGPTFVIEFLNMQADGAKNPANHIHSAWRRLPKDFEAK
ncbi:MAG: DUF3500 domain-containing protein [Gemmataceae bacterium]|nr:DUF3500 domain-containing protein [Gemmataceae bacterium]